MAKLEAGSMSQQVYGAPFLAPPSTNRFPGLDVTCVPLSDLDAERERLYRALQAKDLEIIHKQLWEVILTEDPRLHLVWSKHVLYVQRLPDELLDWTYFTTVICDSPDLYKTFLLSYTSLIKYPSDLDVAKASGLITKKAEWRSWRNIRSSILEELQGRDIHDRFEYGELRLGRVDTIFRLRLMGLSYFAPRSDYESYFEHHYTTLIALFALVSVALSAMQVINGITGVPAAVTVTAYRFSIASLLLLAGSCTILFVLYIGLYLGYWLVIYARRQKR
ncbi:hypothetical protein LTR35_000334 [Friedmanniomyces endolithicus]|nr:hypothetical protein LTS00_013317 [Friedmanniomyces endolithicus]KAK0293728.1 hypothetical protein LTR35_000334 [Friedmanniomyces endolithicus]KAK0985886.1 hypothetical protein LTR54_013549 [Friedmanniomyces endolithicus]